MPRKLLIEQFHLNVYVPWGLRPAEADAMRRSMQKARFRSRLRRAVEAVFRRYRSLRQTTLDVTR
ncbi:MAG TPA: hypothetical protein VH120_15590 [Gemmataceae bacterium]|jgi:hypothetical protein|nr:hypothetical protein [Gemmataceae bacterium]